MSSRKRKATEEPEGETKEAEVGHSYEVTGDAGEAEGESRKISVPPTKERIAAMRKEYNDRKWGEDVDPSNPNLALAKAYKQRYLPTLNPTDELFISVDRPGQKVGNKKWKSDSVFTNVKFISEPSAMRAELVFPLSRAVGWDASLQSGNWFRNSRNKGKDMKFLANKLTEAKKSIAFDASPFKRESKGKDGKVVTYTSRKDSMGRNADFMDAVTNIGKVSRMLVEMLANEQQSLAPKYFAEEVNKFYSKKAETIQGTYNALAASHEEDYKAEKMAADDYKRRIAALRKKYFVGKTGKVDEARMKASMQPSDLIDHLMTECNTDKLKTDKNGKQYFVLEAKVTRNTSELEKKGWDVKTNKIVAEFAPDFPDDACKAVFVSSKGQKTINHHTWTDLSKWGKTENVEDLNKVLTDKEREQKGIESWERTLDPLSIAGAKLTLTPYLFSPQGTVGVRVELTDIIYYSNATKEDIAESKRQGNSGFQPKEEDKIEVGGADDYAPTELTKEVDKLDARMVASDVEAAMKEAADKAAAAAAGKKSSDDEDTAMISAADNA